MALECLVPNQGLINPSEVGNVNRVFTTQDDSEEPPILRYSVFAFPTAYNPVPTAFCVVYVDQNTDFDTFAE